MTKLSTKLDYSNKCKCDEKGQFGTLTLLQSKPLLAVKGFDVTIDQHMAQISLNLALSCSMVVLSAVILPLMPFASSKVPDRAAFNSPWLALLGFPALIWMSVGVCTIGVCARLIPFNCNKNNTSMTEQLRLSYDHSETK